MGVAWHRSSKLEKSRFLAVLGMTTVKMSADEGVVFSGVVVGGA
jgi:hypothetical protein